VEYVAQLTEAWIERVHYGMWRRSGRSDRDLKPPSKLADPPADEEVPDAPRMEVSLAMLEERAKDLGPIHFGQHMLRRAAAIPVDSSERRQVSARPRRRGRAGLLLLTRTARCAAGEPRAAAAVSHACLAPAGVQRRR
jgi:hypothetical protein